MTDVNTAPEATDSAGDDADDVVILTITDEALVKVREVRSAEDDGDTLGLRVEIVGEQGVDFQYDLAMDPVAEAADDDVVYEVSGIPVIVPANTVEQLRGATLDLPSNPMQGGLVIRNPNRPDPLKGATIDLEGTVEERVNQLLNKQINPSLQAHGGACQVIKVEEPKVWVTMSGGCQGCAMSAATLRDGITVMITEMIPEITEVIDTTDHDAGDNPYFN